MAEFKELTMILGHTPANNFDGYAPHRHVELINMTVADYTSKVVGKGLVYPTKEYKHLILSPYQLPWVKQNIKCVGYDFLEVVEPAHAGLYALGEKGDLHDGIDSQVIDGPAECYIKTVKSGYKNALGYNATADVYKVQVDKILELWQTQLGYDALDEFAKSGLVKEPERWKKTLDEPVSQWLFWQMMSRLSK